MAKKKTDIVVNWDKIYVICGEPCVSRITLLEFLEGKGKTKRFYKNENANLKNILTSYSIIPQRIVIHDPNAETLKICLEVIEANRVTVDKLIIIVAGDNIDARISFYSKAQKNKRIYTCPYIEANESAKLTAHLADWQVGSEVEIEPKAKQWLLKNAPIIVEKLKATGGKKDTEVYDLVCLESELDKIATLCKYEQRAITVEDVVNYCDFDQVSDIWYFIKSSLDGDYITANKLWSQLVSEQGISSVLWLLYSQLTFLLQLKQLLNNRITDFGVLQEKMSFKHYLNKYTNENWQLIEGINEPSINPWRIRKAVESSANWSMETLVSQHEAVVRAIIDMRSSGKEDIVMPYLILALSNHASYKNFLYSA